MADKKELAAWGMTVLLLAAAGVLIFMLYEREMREPWTRDGQVVADIVLVSSPLSGVVESAPVKSDSAVGKGSLLFSLETAPFRQAQEEAESALRLAEARERALRLKLEQGRKGVPEEDWGRLHAEFQAAQAAVVRERTAQLSANKAMEALEVRAPADGFVMQCGLQPGTSVKAGEPLFALAVRESFRVTGFFRETLISRIRPGDRAKVTLMAFPERTLEGVVESVGRGIARSDGMLDRQLLPQVTPTFDWIRLAQRFPVRVRLDELPPDIELRVGLTASVEILGPGEDVRAGRAPEAGAGTAPQAE